MPTNCLFVNFPACLKARFWVGLLLLVQIAHAQRGTEASEYDIKWVPLPDLSASRNIKDVFQDRYGVLWIGSQSGLYRYDGVSAQAHRLYQTDTVFECPIRAIQEDEAGNLWVATENGLKIMDPTRSRLLPFAALKLPESFEKLRNINVTNGPDGSLYVAFGKYIYQYRLGRLILHYTIPAEDDYDPALFKYSPVDRLIWTNNAPPFANRLILLEENGEIVQKMPLYDEKQHLISDWVNVHYLSFHVSADSVAFYQIYSNPNRPYLSSKLEYDLVRRCLIYREEQERQSDIQQQLSYMQDFMQKNQLIAPGTDSGFSINNSYHFSHHVEAYVSTEGLFILQAKQNHFKPVKASLGKRIRAIQSDRYGHLMYGTYNGTYWQRQEEAQAHLLETGQLRWSINPLDGGRTRFFIEEDKGNKYWVYIKGTNNGVWIEQEKVIPSPNQHPFSSAYFGLAEDTLRKGIWHYLHRPDACFQILFYDQAEDKHYYLNKICNFHEPRSIIIGKDLWLAGYFGLKRFVNPDPKSGSLREDNSKIPELFKNSSMLTLYQDAYGQLWICPDGKGLIRYQPETGQYEQFTIKEGLPDNSVYSILGEPGDSVLWLGTGKGLSRFDVRKRLFDNYYTEDGLTHNEFNTAAAYRAPDGTMYMGGQNGIVAFNPENFRAGASTLRQSAFARLLGNGGNSDVQQFILTDGAFLQIPPNVQVLQLTFHTDDYLHAERQHFRYRIPGVIDQWQYLNYNDKALFPYLPSGHHVLEVQTQTFRGLWLPPVHYNLNILPPWYATWWFRTLIVLAIAATLYALYLSRIRQLRREFDLRQQISHDLHDNLGSRIYLLRSLSHQIANPLLPDEAKQQNLSRFEEISQDTFKTIRDFIWAFDPKQDEVAQLFERMDNFAENYLSPLIKELSIDCPDIPAGHKIGPRSKHHLMSIYQELLTNMIKHTHSQAIHIQMTLDGKNIIVSICNQHLGYQHAQEPQKAEESYGGESLKNRLAEINAQLQWSEPSPTSQMALLTAPL